MPFSVQFDVLGVKQVNRSLMSSADAVKDLSPVWDDIYDDFLKREGDVFSSEGNVGSKSREFGVGAGKWGPWEPLNKIYAARKLAKGFGSKILVRTGRLRDSLTSRGHGDAVFGPQLLRVAMGTRTPYAGYHQGNKDFVDTGKIPRREPVRVGEAQVRFWMRLIHKFVLESGQFVRE